MLNPHDSIPFDFDEGDFSDFDDIAEFGLDSSEAHSEPVDYVLEPVDFDSFNSTSQNAIMLLNTALDNVHDNDNRPLAIKLDLYVDSEYTTDQNLSCQLLLVTKDVSFKVVAVNSAFRSFISPELESRMRSEHDIFLLFLNLDDPSSIHLTSILDFIFPLILTESTKKVHWIIDLYFFYAVRDLSILFGLDAMLPLYKGERGSLRPRRGLSGFFQLEDSVTTKSYFFKYSVRIKDLVGIDVEGLLEIANSCGLQMPDKGFFDGMKSNMDEALRQHPEKFLLYGMGDALILKDILYSKLASYNSILSEVHKIGPSDLMTKDTIPLTLGSIVNVVWETYLNCIIYKKNVFIRLAMAKFSLLSSSHPDYRRNLVLHESLMRFNSLDEMSTHYTHHPNELSDMYDLVDKPNVFMYEPFQFASIKRFVDFSKDTTISVLAFRNGGRTNNEDPFNYVCYEGADPDIAGAYGSALMDGTYPFGRPRIFAYSSGEKTIKLGRFLRKYASDLESGLYTIVVSGKLSFDQDLIYSKIVPQSSVYSKSDRFDPDRIETAEFSGDFVLLRREIINGFLTKDLLYILKKVCTNFEFGEIKNLDVVAAAFWSQEDRVSCIEELADAFLADKGRISYEMSTTSLKDTRTYKWYGLPLSSFIAPLMEKRAFFKKQKDPTSQAIQNSIKAIVNTFYGIVSSVFFPLNNTVVSNMVTARIRGAVWLLSKPLGLRMTICDGGFYEFSKTRFISSSSRLPGLASFSSFQSIEDHGSIRIAPLGDFSIDWHSLFSSKTPPEQFPNLDDLVTKHVNDFWSNYNLTIFFKIEHKVSNIFKKAGYIMKAHYAFLIYDSETQDYTKEKYKIRGLSLRDVHDPSIRHNPIYNIIESILHDNDYPEIYEYYQERKLLSMRNYRRALIKPKSGKLDPRAEFVPGDAYIEEKYFRLNNTYCFLYFLKDYTSRDRRSLYTFSKKTVDGPSVKVKSYLFEKYIAKYGLQKTIQFINENNLKIQKKE